MTIVLLMCLFASLGFNAYLIFKPTKYVGSIVVAKLPTGKKLFSLDLNGNPDEIDQRKSLTFKVVKEQSSLYDDMDDPFAE